MEHYIAQKAQQALEALASDGSRSERLKLARAHFAMVDSKHFLATAPPDVRDSIKSFMQADIENDLQASARACRLAIECVLETFGRQDVSSEARAN